MALVAVAGVVVCALTLGVWVLWPRDATELSTEDALADFRQAAARSEDTRDAAGPGAATTESLTPEPGVYEYRSSGTERVKLGPLPAEDRTLPDTVTIVVGEPTEGADGTTCFEWTLNLFQQHSETTTWCTDTRGSLTLDAHIKHQSIGALSPTATVSCDPSTLIDPTEEISRLDCGLTLDGGPASITAELRGTAERGTTAELEIDGQPVKAIPFTVNYEVTGGLEGSWEETIWLGENLLPLRVERHLELSGPATLSETSTLDLADPLPAR